MKDSRLLIRISILFCLVMSISSCNVNDTSSLIDESVISSEICEHSYRKEIVKKATIIEDGLYKNICEKCGYEEDVAHKYYDLDELVFEDQIFMYDGNPHELTIKGLLPLNVNVIYKNNSLKEIGSKEAIAEFYDENNNLIETKKANIKVVENTGLENIYIDTNNVAITSKETYVDMTLSVDNCDSKYIKNNVSGQIRWRGNGTLTYDKKAYRLKFDEKQDMLGLNDGIKARSWVLLADYNDQSMLRNTGAFFIGNSLFNYSNNYCTSYKHVNVYLNDSYNGVYLLAEQQQANKNRVNINEPEEDYKDTDIGYLLELDAYANQDPYNFTVGDSSTQRIGNVNLSRKSQSVILPSSVESLVVFSLLF